jgi:hypothetical protein
VACQQLFRLGLLLFVLQKKRKEKKRKEKKFSPTSGSFANSFSGWVFFCASLKNKEINQSNQ